MSADKEDLAAAGEVSDLRKRVGRVLGPLAFVALLAAPTGLTPQAHALAAITVLTVVLWVTEAIPLAAAALLAPALAVLLGVTGATEAFAPLASPLIFLFMGGFMLALALAEQGLDRRAALWLLGRRWVAGSPARASSAIAMASFALSMWISNTATTAMLIPVALGLCRTIRAAAPLDEQHRFDRHAEGTLLGLTYAASLGGVATPVGTAPNVIALGMLEEQAGIKIDFFQWIKFALPTSLLTLLAVLLLVEYRFPAPVARLAALSETVEEELRKLGPMSSGERRAAGVFMLAVAGWLTPSILKLSLGPGNAWTTWAARGLDEGVVAILAGVLVCLVPSGKRDGKPVLGFDRAMRLDWGTLLLLGGGLSLGKLMFDTGLAKTVAQAVLALAGPLASSPLGLLACSTLLVLYLTEITSNVATTSMMVPVLMAIAQAGGNDPVPTTLCVTMAASYAFMLPVSTPPNAIAYGTGLIRIGTMIRTGFWLDIVGFLIIFACGALLLPRLTFG
ncbi:MAG: DASS family sodium-coupled anion symporter [Myxococcales bacterium]|nr:DASS family sodium-coupled anion symporter [Myxococcales bacterium]